MVTNVIHAFIHRKSFIQIEILEGIFCTNENPCGNWHAYCVSSLRKVFLPTRKFESAILTVLLRMISQTFG